MKTIKILAFFAFLLIANFSFSQSMGQLCTGSYKDSKVTSYQKKLSNKDSVYSTIYLVYFDKTLSYRVTVSHIKKEKKIEIRTEDVSGDVVSAGCSYKETINYTELKPNILVNGTYVKSYTRGEKPNQSVVFFMNDKYENVNVSEVKLCFGNAAGKDLFLLFNEKPVAQTVATKPAPKKTTQVKKK
ncbi:MAG: hypothetical protein WCK02_13230 [Bacteroidota bacterium]